MTSHLSPPYPLIASKNISTNDSSGSHSGNKVLFMEFYRRLQPAASRRGPRGRDAAALLALPAPGGRLRARPPRARFGQGSAARRHCPSPVAALRQLSWPRSVAPRAPSAPGPTWPPSPAPGAPVGPPRSERRGKRSGAGRRQRLLPQIGRAHV